MCTVGPCCPSVRGTGAPEVTAAAARRAGALPVIQCHVDSRHRLPVIWMPQQNRMAVRNEKANLLFGTITKANLRDATQNTVRHTQTATPLAWSQARSEESQLIRARGDKYGHGSAPAGLPVLHQPGTSGGSPNLPMGVICDCFKFVQHQLCRSWVYKLALMHGNGLADFIAWHLSGHTGCVGSIERWDGSRMARGPVFSTCPISLVRTHL